MRAYKETNAYTELNLTVEAYKSLTKFNLHCCLCSLFCMTISTYIQYTGNLIHPVNQSASRDLSLHSSAQNKGWKLVGHLIKVGAL